MNFESKEKIHMGGKSRTAEKEKKEKKIGRIVALKAIKVLPAFVQANKNSEKPIKKLE